MPSKSELKALGVRKGWNSIEISVREIEQMSADEVLWHEAFNKENWDRAFTLSENGRLNRERMPIWNVRRMWRGEASGEETEKARIAGDQFATRFPQFHRTLDNAQVMVAYMESHDLNATKLESYVSAYKALMEEGKLSLAPPQSADEFVEAHPELKDNRVPPLVASRHRREQNTTAQFAASTAATNEGSVTRMVDYPHQLRGVPPQSDKHSFRMKVRSLSASEIAQRCADDPAFKAALDALD